jgi:hypothetical protein
VAHTIFRAAGHPFPGRDRPGATIRAAFNDLAFKDVRTFAWEVKHVTASNYFLWSPVTGDRIPENVTSEKGLDQMKTKADIVRFPKDSFVLATKPRLG